MILLRCLLCLAFTAAACDATGVLRRAVGGRGVALSGALLAQPENPLDAMFANPAGLAWLSEPTLSVGYLAAYGDASFQNALNGESKLRTNFGQGAELALSWPLPNKRGALGLSVIPEAANVANWRYLDSPGGADGATTYGRQRHRSEFIAVRGALGIGYQLSDRLAIGGSLGLVYEEVLFQAPFIFQSAPGLAGFKTLLNLDTDGVAWNGELSLLYRITDDLNLALRYRSSTNIESTGSASGNAGAQIANLGLPIAPSFRFGATAELSLPDLYSIGLSWQATPQLLLLGQLDYIPWSDHFDAMDIRLRNGSNPGLPAGIDDRVPIGWSDRFVVRAGLEYQFNETWTGRLGYSWTRSPIPSSHVTPLNAAISSHSLSAGIGWQRGAYRVDLGYQLDLPHSQSVGLSAYQAGEYSHSSLELLSHWLSLTATISF